jgi:hypothetical protein
LAVVVLSCVALGACQGVEPQFIGLRVKDACDGTWPICSTTVGCLVGDRSYVEGRFPGTAKVALQLFEPSTVVASFLLSELSGSGEETVVTFYEDRCRSRIRTPITGRTFIGEAQQRGSISREADLSGIGDHLIEVNSDARVHYLMKVDVVPLRLKGSNSVE